MDDLTILCVLLAVGLAILVHVPTAKRSRMELGMMGFVMGIVAICAVAIDATLDTRQMVILIMPCVLTLGLTAIKMLDGVR